MKACPRCQSERTQRGFHDPPLLLRALGLHGFMCNNCGLEFNRFAPFAEPERSPSKKKELTPCRRRSPRYAVRLPATVMLMEVNRRSGDVWHSRPSNGHCTTISRHGLSVSFAGARFSDEDFANTGRLLHITVMLPNGPAEMLVNTVTHERRGGKGARLIWVVGASIREMKDEDRARLDEYLSGKVLRELPI